MQNDELTRHVTTAYLAASGSWQGCDWMTSFGPRGLDLRGLQAKQTRLLAEATSGKEAEDWAAATRWLEQVERVACDARSAASAAVELFGKQQWSAALASINVACGLEATYHEQLIWGPLRDLIAAAACRENSAQT